jgi:uncharacterized protein YndB with AHSA1/START domain/predicted SnoaL-like aldol condensation-catalyzing enzyme
MQGHDMAKLNVTQAPSAQTGMLIRKPVADVFEALVNPDITTKFWFTKSSGRLDTGKQVRWDWEMYDVSIQVTVRAIEPNSRILIEWPGYSGPTTVEWTFAPQNDGTTFVRVTESGFTGSAEQLIKYVADSTQGFTLTLAGMKALLEHGVKLNLVADRYPKGIDEQQLTAAWRGSRTEGPSRRDTAVSFLRLVAAGQVRDAYDRCVGANFRHHNAYFRGDRESLMRAMEENAAKSPGKVLDVKNALEDGNHAVVHSHIRQHAQDRGGAAVHIFRFENDRIAELWDVGQPIPSDSPNEYGMF